LFKNKQPPPQKTHQNPQDSPHIRPEEKQSSTAFSPPDSYPLLFAGRRAPGLRGDA